MKKERKTVKEKQGIEKKKKIKINKGKGNKMIHWKRNKGKEIKEEKKTKI